MLLDMLRVAGQLSRVREGHGQGVPHVAQERPVPAIAPCKWWRRGPGEGHHLVIGLAAAIVLRALSAYRGYFITRLSVACCALLGPESY